jgi:hypothetical protein
MEEGRSSLCDFQEYRVAGARVKPLTPGKLALECESQVKAADFFAAQRFFCAAAIAFRPAALIFRFAFGGAFAAGADSPLHLRPPALLGVPHALQGLGAEFPFAASPAFHRSCGGCGRTLQHGTQFCDLSIYVLLFRFKAVYSGFDDFFV